MDDKDDDDAAATEEDADDVTTLSPGVLRFVVGVLMIAHSSYRWFRSWERYIETLY
jgi:hypothetical protein